MKVSVDDDGFNPINVKIQTKAELEILRFALRFYTERSTASTEAMTKKKQVVKDLLVDLNRLQYT